MDKGRWIRFVPRAERQRLESECVPAQGRTVECLLTSYQGRMQVYYGEIEAGGGLPEGQGKRHGGEEYAFIIEGQLEYYLGEEKFIVREGDIICFTATLPHRFHNPGPGKTRVLWGEID